METYYEILEVSNFATFEEIKKSHRNLAKKWHPDRSKHINSEERMKKINEAYEILRDFENRKRYDEFLKMQNTRQGSKTNSQETHNQSNKTKQHNYHEEKAEPNVKEETKEEKRVRKINEIVDLFTFLLGGIAVVGILYICITYPQASIPSAAIGIGGPKLLRWINEKIKNILLRKKEETYYDYSDISTFKKLTISFFIGIRFAAMIAIPDAIVLLLIYHYISYRRYKKRIGVKKYFKFTFVGITMMMVISAIGHLHLLFK